MAKSDSAKKNDWIPLANRIIQKPEEIPNLVMRCIVGVMDDKRLTGSLRKKFEGAVGICNHSLRQSKRLDDKQPLEVMKLTSVGLKRDRERRKQKDQSKKKSQFDRLIRRLQQDSQDEEKSLEARSRGKQP